MSFRREKFIPKGGPDGGDGGPGGSVILRADPQVDSLVSFFYEPHLRARDGVHGKGKQMTGKAGPDRFVPVPVGTLVYRLPPGQTISPVRDADSADPGSDDPASGAVARGGEDSGEAPELLTDLAAPGQEFVLCRGGNGGKGNVHFKSSRNRVPIQSQPGHPGEEGYFLFELRTIADVGLVGYPNAGKSTLLSRLSSARPKVAPYPFTTLHPIVGVMEFPGYLRATVADIPGLIEGAHRNVGLGHEFLRHIVRCRLLLFVLDLAGSEGRNPLEDFASLRRELALYDPTLADRPALVVGNKADLAGAADHARAFQERFPRFPFYALSAERGDGLPALRDALATRLATAVPPTPAGAEANSAPAPGHAEAGHP